MEKTEILKVEMHHVSFRSVVPAVPKDEGEKLQLIEDLAQIGCEGLFAHPWSLRSDEMVQEFSQMRSNEWEGTIRRDPGRWTTETWAKVYYFLKEGRGYALRIDKFATGKFSTLINPKDGYVVADCEDPRERRVSEFIVPILYPKKPIRITVTLSNTIFGALLVVR